MNQIKSLKILLPDFLGIKINTGQIVTKFFYEQLKKTTAYVVQVIT